MSEEENQTEEKNKKSPLGLILILFIALAGLLGFGLFKNAQKANMNETSPNLEASENGIEKAIEVVENKIEDAQETLEENQIPMPEEDQENSASENPDTTTASAASSENTLDITSLSTPRVLGNPDAPVKITEHSSFTCGHCGSFHATNFKIIKEEYIDTGKAYLVFDDFPRNRPDLLIGAIARCVPEHSYFNFIQLIFETQKEWLPKKDEYIEYIKQNAVLAGADKDEVEKCYTSQELHEEMAERREVAFKQNNVKSTPTLIINDTVNIGGMDKYETIKSALDAAYESATKDAE